jgi:inhibitor of cysteine peptidase
MHREFAAIAVLVLAAIGCGSDDASIPVLDATDTGSEVEVAVGEQFEIRLDSNPTTGYAWQVVDQPAVVELVSSDYEAPDTNSVGAGGVEVFVFAGASSGSAELRLQYVQSFEEPPEPADTVEFQVTVGG